MSRPAVSQHLRVLKGAGLVTERRDGTRHLYRVDPDGLAALRTYLETYWSDVLVAFKDAADRGGRHDDDDRTAAARASTVSRSPRRRLPPVHRATWARGGRSDVHSLAVDEDEGRREDGV